ncbi:MAG: LysR family transcriptional regulator [Cellulosilyticaceae bacterium]
MIANLNLYRVFSEVAKHQNFSKAAQSLYMSQPAVSQSISQLETDLGVRLFTRTSKGVSVTHDGILLLEYIEPALNLIKAGERKLADTQDLMWGELKIGVGDTISRYYLLPYLEKFHHLYSQIKLQIINRTTFELCRLVKSGEIDLAICNLPIEDASLEIKECFQIEDVFVCGKLYKEKVKEPITLESLERLPLILLEEKANSRQYIEKYMSIKGIKIKPEIELGSHELLLEFAKYNLGIACVVKEFAEEYLNRGEVIALKLEEQIPKRGIGVCYLKSLTQTAATKRFINILEEELT